MNIAMNPSRQRGAALVVGLILLLVLTLLAVSGMSTATFELTMAGNTQYGENAFQNAETGIEVALERGGFTTLASTQWPLACNAAVPPLPFCTETEFQATTAPFDGAYSIGSFSAYHFDIVSEGAAQRNAQSTHTQGFYVIGPSSGTP
ncbi:MAG: PilX N-terminal domain-containing pilus assembly protein [Gammaproteobacteria bacterium]